MPRRKKQEQRFYTKRNRTLTYPEFLVKAQETYYLVEDLGVPLGMWYYATLGCDRPDLTTAVTNTPIDPFYDNRNIMPFLDYIQRNW